MNALIAQLAKQAAGPAAENLARMKRNFRVSKGNIIRKNTLVLTTTAAVDTAFGDVVVVLAPSQIDGTFTRMAVAKDSFELIDQAPTAKEVAAEAAVEAS